MAMKEQRRNQTSKQYKPLQEKRIDGRKYLYGFTVRGKAAKVIMEKADRCDLAFLQIPDTKTGTMQFWIYK